MSTSCHASSLVAIIAIKTMNRFTQYIKDTRAEMSHVNWPTRVETVRYTAMVILVSSPRPSCSAYRISSSQDC